MPASQADSGNSKSYRLKRGAQGLYLLVGVACIVLGFLLYIHAMPQPLQESIGIRTGAGGMILMGIYLSLGAFLYKILLNDESVTVRGVFRSSSLRRIDVRGRRMIRSRNGSYLMLEAKEPEGSILTVSNYFQFDKEWTDWVQSLPDLDEEDRDAILKQIEDSAEPGEDSETPARKLQQARSIAVSLSILSFAAGMPLWIYGSSLDPNLFRGIDVLLVMLPWAVVAMQARWPHLYSLMGGKRDPRPSLMVVLFGSGVCLMASPFDNMHVDGFASLSVLALVPALGLSVALFRIAPRGPKPAVLFIGLFIISYFYGYGACSQINTQMDVSTPHQYSANIAGKAMHDGRSTSYHLYLDPWGPERNAGDVSVARPLFDAVRVGDAVCITAHDGELRAAWHTVERCR